MILFWQGGICNRAACGEGSPPFKQPTCLFSLAQRRFGSEDRLQSITQEELQPVSHEGLQQPNSVVYLLGKLEVTIPCIYTTLSTIGEGDQCNAIKQINHSSCSALTHYNVLLYFLGGD